MPSRYPKHICYSLTPNQYVAENAEALAALYDGFFFSVGAWDTCGERFLSCEPSDPSWFELAEANVSALRKAGADQNILTVSFPQEGIWPSPQTLLSKDYRDGMHARFSEIGRASRDLGFRGVCIDVEYPYPRYDLTHPVYTYEGYTAGDLLSAARAQGTASARGIIENHDVAVVIVLPGTMRCRPVERMYLAGILGEMAERDAPGGFHLGTEFTYGLHDPVTVAATCRCDDGIIPFLVGDRAARYWRSSCSMAPGVWPLHMMETGGENYPVRSWAEEMGELAEEMGLLRSLAKRYVWSYGGAPLWYLHTEEVEVEYGLVKQFPASDLDLNLWHGILRSEPRVPGGMGKLIEQVRRFDEGHLSAEELCDRFGTPGRWWVLGMVGNPRSCGGYGANEALADHVDVRKSYHGRDGVVRWFAYDNVDPRGITNCRAIFDYHGTDNAAAHFRCFIHAREPVDGFLNAGWDDGLVVRLAGEVVLEEVDYPPEGHGWLYRDRYSFERRVPVRIGRGHTTLAVTSLNSHGAWLFSLRLTDGDGRPLQGLAFRLE